MNTYPEFVDAFAIVKLAATRANTQVGAMKPERLAVSRPIGRYSAAVRVRSSLCCAFRTPILTPETFRVESFGA
jgi:hypothetical protein